MPHIINSLLMAAAGLMAGLTIGFAFGKVQEAAYKRNMERQQLGRLQSGWSVMPGSFTRVAMLLLALALVQMVCPLLFVRNTEWWVSGGLVCGYGWMLYRQMRQRMSAWR